MPHYDYQCPACGRFEVWQSIQDEALSACPSCGARVQRLISASVGFVLKGSGFYQNDSRPAPAPENPPSMGGCGACGSPDPCPNGN
ncbi:MAG TPA: FmdB family zinc ribbon protein [bacterium]|nr:FmdB family zinc ribbon protein [bacterium]